MRRTDPARQSDRNSIHMIGSLGGHLELLIAAARGVEDCEIVWITSAGVRADELRLGGAVVHELPRLDRGSVSPRSVGRGLTLAYRERPTTVVTSGAGLAVPFCLVARLFGARLVFMETMARVRKGSRTGRLLSKLASDVIVQWPELLETSYPNAHWCAPILLDGVGKTAENQGAGTFVTVGSHDAPFDRLLHAVEHADSLGLLPRPVFVQYGVGSAPGGQVEGAAWLDPEQFRRRMNDARLVITHGGAGAIGTSLRCGRTPIVVARSAALGEHVDDHQSDLVDKLDEIGLIVKVDEVQFTAAHVAAASKAPDGRLASDRPTVTETLESILYTTC